MNRERKEIATKIVALTVSELNKKIPWTVIKGLKIGITLKRGHAHPLENRITIPIWVLKRSIHYVRYYVCHEIAHLLTFNQGFIKEHHGENFKNIEKLLCGVFGVTLAFSNGRTQAYPSALFGPDGHFERHGK